MDAEEAFMPGEPFMDVIDLDCLSPLLQDFPAAASC
jgi:hypothetical protein